MERVGQRGFSLAEVLLAIMIVTAVLLPLSGVFSAGMALGHGIRQRQAATAALYNTAAVLQAVPFERLLPGTHVLPGPDLPEGRTSVTITVNPKLALVQAAVRVTWISPTGPQSLERQVLRGPFGPYAPDGEAEDNAKEAS